MEKEFVPYELALELKQIEFDEPCLAWYPADTILLFMGMKLGSTKPDFVSQNSTWLQSKIINTCIAPTFSQAFRWFRENDFLISFSSHDKDTHDFYIKWGTMEQGKSILSDTYNTYEEAELECLKKLIEIKNR